MQTILSLRVYAILQDGDVLVKRAEDGEELLRLTLLAAEDLSGELARCAEHGRELATASPTST